MDAGALGTSALLALFLVPVVSLIKRPEWSAQAKHVLGLVAALVAAIAGAFVDGSVTGGTFVSYLGTAFVSAQSLYALYFKGTDLDSKLTAK